MKKPRRKFHEQAVRANYGADLRGIGHSTLQRQRGLKGSKLGPANEGRHLSVAERKEIETQLRNEGKLS